VLQSDLQKSLGTDPFTTTVGTLVGVKTLPVLDSPFVA
jgi:hypothetical protein